MGCPRCWLLSVLDGSYCQCFSFFGALAGMTRASAVEMAALSGMLFVFGGPGGDDQDID